MSLTVGQIVQMLQMMPDESHVSGQIVVNGTDGTLNMTWHGVPPALAKAKTLCPPCGGTGELKTPDGSEACAVCGGTGLQLG